MSGVNGGALLAAGGLASDLPVGGMGYCLDDVDEAEARILRAVPGAIPSRTDFDFSLSVAKPDGSRAFVVYRAGREDIGQVEVIGDVDAIIAWLNAGSGVK